MKSKSGIQILVVEDEPIISMLIEDMLIEIGCKNIKIMASISSALEFLGGAQPDFTILDINLNGTRSYPVAALLKSRKIPFVFVSGYDAATLDLAYADVQLLQKPFRIGDLDLMIETALALTQADSSLDRRELE
ncbi:MAG TPA: response regulator [Methylocella sp.]|nr:response regulator [Methylocella sp.]